MTVLAVRRVRKIARQLERQTLKSSGAQLTSTVMRRLSRTGEPALTSDHFDARRELADMARMERRKGEYTSMENRYSHVKHA